MILANDRLQYIGEALGIAGAVLVALPSSLAHAKTKENAQKKAKWIREGTHGY